MERIMCMNPESFWSFVSRIPAEVVERMHFGFLLIGEAQTLWVWLPQHGVWCIQGIY